MSTTKLMPPTFPCGAVGKIELGMIAVDSHSCSACSMAPTLSVHQTSRPIWLRKYQSKYSHWKAQAQVLDCPADEFQKVPVATSPRPSYSRRPLASSAGFSTFWPSSTVSAISTLSFRVAISSLWQRSTAKLQAPMVDLWGCFSWRSHPPSYLASAAT